jgi:hypothetical protein
MEYKDTKKVTSTIKGGKKETQGMNELEHGQEWTRRFKMVFFFVFSAQQQRRR